MINLQFQTKKEPPPETKRQLSQEGFSTQPATNHEIFLSESRGSSSERNSAGRRGQSWSKANNSSARYFAFSQYFASFQDQVS